MIYRVGLRSIDPGAYEIRCEGQHVPAEPQVFELIVMLIRNRDRVITKDEIIAHVWNGRIVSDATLNSRISAARQALGDDGSAQKVIRTVHGRGFRFVGEVREEPGSAPSSPRDAAAQPMPKSERSSQEITFCRTKDGVSLAVGCAGRGQPVVAIAPWLSHLEHDWQGPLRGPLWHHLAGRFRLIRYDGRGLGLSDRNVNDISFATFECDLEAVVDALALRRYALFGISQGAATAIAHAVRHPERVSKIVLLGGFARGRNKRADKDAILAKAFLDIMREGWGEEDSVLLGIFSSLYSPGASPDQMKWHARLQRACASAETAVRLRSECDDVDIADLLPKVSAPTLVLHSRHDKAVPCEEGRRLAGSIEHARFVSLESENHMPLAGEPAWQMLIEVMESFLSEPDAASRPAKVVRLARP